MAFISILILGIQLYALYSDGYGIIHEDEAIYYNGARLFAETNQPIANHCIAENVSKIGGYNWYGPFWNVYFGTFLKLIPLGKGILVANILASILVGICSVVLIPKKSVLFTILLLCSFPFTYHQFFLFPEPLILLLSIVNMVGLVKTINNPTKSALLLFSAFVIIQIPIRITSVFWLFGLIPLISKKNFFPISTYILTGFLSSVLFLKFFSAPAFVKGISNIGNFSILRIFEIIENTLYTIQRNMTNIFTEHHPFVILLLVLIILFFWFTIKKQTEILISFSIIIAFSFCIYFSFYTTQSNFFLKQTIFIWPMLILGFVYETSSTKIIMKVLLAACLTFPFVLLISYKNINRHTDSYIKFMKQNNIQYSFNRIKKYETNNETLSIILNSRGFSDISNIAMYLPILNEQQFPIIYSSNIVTSNSNYKDKYELFNKLEIELIIIPLDEISPTKTFKLTETTEHFKILMKAEPKIIYD